MGKSRVSALALSLIIVSMTLSGCISNNEKSSDDEIDEVPELVYRISRKKIIAALIMMDMIDVG